jgi:hypothetical protein
VWNSFDSRKRAKPGEAIAVNDEAEADMFAAAGVAAE